MERQRKRRGSAWAVVGAAIAVVLVGGGAWLIAGGDLALFGGSEAGENTTETITDDPVGPLAALQRVPAVGGWSDRDYDRDLFGQPWADVDRNGCDTRNDVLGRDLLGPTFLVGTGECKVLTGTLIDPYDGSVVRFVAGPETSVDVQIDHVVALSWAWHHGADTWTSSKREKFANDPRNLVASAEATNQAKSAFGPGQWLPSEPELRCGYLEQFVAVLVAYELGIGVDDRDAATAALAACA